MSARAAAFFDLDGTIVRGNIVAYYARMRMARMSPIARGFWLSGFLFKALGYWLVDKISRRRFNTIFYRNYRSFTAGELEEAAGDHARRHLRPHVFPQALERLRHHQSEGHPVIVVSGSIEQIIRPLSDWLGVDRVYCAHLEQRDDGSFSGELTDGPVSDDTKAEFVKRFARENDVDLKESFAYADSMDDLPMLACVGNPAVINPSRKLERIARDRGWPAYRWSCDRS